MHPNRAFEWTDKDDMLRFAAEQSFAHIFTCASGEPGVVHAPVLVVGGKVQFHLARRNRLASSIGSNRVLISILGRHSYQSANWYVSANQVPTWHYEAVEIEGIAREMTAAELIGFLDLLTQTHERRVEPEHPWTREKMEPGRFEAMIQAIVGFEVTPNAIRGTKKFNQHKAAGDLEATIKGQVQAGRTDIAEAIRDLKEKG